MQISVIKSTPPQVDESRLALNILTTHFSPRKAVLTNISPNAAEIQLSRHLKTCVLASQASSFEEKKRKIQEQRQRPSLRHAYSKVKVEILKIEIEKTILCPLFTLELHLNVQSLVECKNMSNGRLERSLLKTVAAE